MTPEQRSALEGVRGGDLVLVITPEGLTSPPHDIARLLLVDFITPNDLSSPYPEIARLLLIDSVRMVGMMTRRTVYIRGPGSLGPHDWVAFQRNPSGFWRNFQQGGPVTAIDTLLVDEDIVLLRPAFDDLFHTLFNGTCPFIPCHEGLVTVSSATRVVLRDIAEAARRYGFNMRTLCPFCMCPTLYRDHELQVESIDYENTPSDYSIIRDEHFGRINARRSELGYRFVAHESALNDLQLEGDRAPLFEVPDSSDLTIFDALGGTDPGSQEEVAPAHQRITLEGSDARSRTLRAILHRFGITPTDLRAQAFRDVIDGLQMTLFSNPGPTTDAFPPIYRDLGSVVTQRPGPSRSTLPPAPITSPVQTPGAVVPGLRVREWYVKAAARVLGEACQICLERFGPGEVVADLPCWHFFHLACWARVEGGKCPFRCNEEMSRDVVEDVVD